MVIGLGIFNGSLNTAFKQEFLFPPAYVLSYSSPFLFPALQLARFFLSSVVVAICAIFQQQRRQ
jgi:hypothetical protein